MAIFWLCCGCHQGGSIGQEKESVMACRASQERINLSAIPSAPPVFFQPLISRLAALGSANSEDSVNNKTVGIMNRISNIVIFQNVPICTILLLGIKHGRLGFIHFWSLVLCWFYPGILFTLFLPFTWTFTCMMFCGFRWPILHLIYLTMIYHKISDLILGIELLKSLIFPLIKTVKMTLIVLIWWQETSPRMAAYCLGNQPMIRCLGLSVPPPLQLPAPNLFRESRGWKLNQSPMTNDLISHAYVMKSP